MSAVGQVRTCEPTPKTALERPRLNFCSVHTIGASLRWVPQDSAKWKTRKRVIAAGSAKPERYRASTPPLRCSRISGARQGFRVVAQQPGEVLRRLRLVFVVPLEFVAPVCPQDIELLARFHTLGNHF